MGAAVAFADRGSIWAGANPSRTWATHRRLAAVSLCVARPPSHRAHHRAAQTEGLVTRYFLRVTFLWSALYAKLYPCETTAAPAASCSPAECVFWPLVLRATPGIHHSFPELSRTMRSCKESPESSKSGSPERTTAPPFPSLRCARRRRLAIQPRDSNRT